jgi:hypothetical protein
MNNCVNMIVIKMDIVIMEHVNALKDGLVNIAMFKNALNNVMDMVYVKMANVFALRVSWEMFVIKDMLDMVKLIQKITQFYVILDGMDLLAIKWIVSMIVLCMEYVIMVLVHVNPNGWAKLVKREHVQIIVITKASVTSANAIARKDGKD